MGTAAAAAGAAKAATVGTAEARDGHSGGVAAAREVLIVEQSGFGLGDKGSANVRASSHAVGTPAVLRYEYIVIADHTSP